MNLDQLLEFCSYYNLIKSSTYLPITAPTQLKPSAPKEDKVVRRKIEKIEPKKQVQAQKPIKAKMEFTGRSQKKSVSPIAKDNSFTKEQPKEQRPKRIDIVQEPKSLTLDYFINHISTHPATHTAYKHSSSPDYTKNYQTFGRTIKQDYNQTYDEKVNKNRGNQTDRNEKKHYDITSFTIKPQGYSQSYNGQPYAQSYSYNQPEPTRVNHQNFGFSQSYNPSQINNQYGNFNATNSPIQRPMWEKPNFDKKSTFVLQLDSSKQDSMLLYSPARRENGPYGSSSALRAVSPDRSLSKSRTQHKRKNSERPFYDPTQLTPPRTERDSEMRQRQPSEAVLSKSILELPENSCYPAKKQIDDENRRETSTTTVKNRKAREVVLDDECQEYLVAALGRAPVAIDIGRSSR